jgi:hypothetical protein
MPLWRGSLRIARQRGRRIESAAHSKAQEFEERRGRVATATERAERAAIQLMLRSDDLARTVASRHD